MGAITHASALSCEAACFTMTNVAPAPALPIDLGPAAWAAVAYSSAEEQS